MKTLLLVMAMAIAACAAAQDRWTVALNSKTLMTATAEDTVRNRVVLPELKKGSLLVNYLPAKAEGAGKRRLLVYSGDQELYRRDDTRLVLPVARLKQWQRSYPRLQLYTIPVLGAAGANVKLRRVHLATLEWE